jgi:hypothetical protein
MALGRPGSTLVEELNRLANGGVLPPKTEWMDDEGAANKLAGTTGLAATGACNIYAGLPISQWQDLQGACNAIAGTVGLGAAEALRRVDM